MRGGGGREARDGWFMGSWVVVRVWSVSWFELGHMVGFLFGLFYRVYAALIRQVDNRCIIICS